MSDCCCGIDCVLWTLGLLVALKVLGDLVVGVYARFVRAEKDFKKFGNWAVVTGATDGIGKAYAFELAKRGLKVLLISRTQEKLDAVKKEIESKSKVEVETLAIDFSKLNSEAKQKVTKSLKDRDVGVLVNNVGMSYDFPEFFSKLSEEKTTELISLNISSATFMTHVVLGGMEERKRGAIVNISSASALFPSPLLAEYGASKTYLEQFSESLAAEVQAKGVHVQVQSPLYVSTKLAKIRSSSLTVPSPEQYAESGMKFIGYETSSSPYWAHALMIFVLHNLPKFISSKIVLSQHLGIRKRAYKKLEEANKSK